MTAIQDLNNQHFLFACEVINDLNRIRDVPIEVSRRSDEDKYFNNDIRWALINIAYLFRRDFFKTFNVLKKGLEDKKKFKEYCMLIPVKKNDQYFVSFLKRVALIYEMAVFCYTNGDNYFLRARDCIAKYQDKKYFFTQGSWKSLTKTASAVRELGNRFLLVILQELALKEPISFVDAIDRVENRARTQNNASVILNGPGMRFLKKEKEKILAREQGKETKDMDLKVEKEKTFTESPESTSRVSSMTSADQGEETKDMDLKVEKEKTFTESPESTSRVSSMTSADKVKNMNEIKTVMKFFERYVGPEVLNKFKHSTESTKYKSSSVSKPPEPLELKKSRTDTESTEEYDYLTTDTACIKLTEDIYFRSNQSTNEQGKVAEDTHGSGDKCIIYQSSSSPSYFPTSINNSTSEECNTRKPSQLEEDLCLSELSLADEHLQQYLGKNETVTGKYPLSVECGSYSSKEPIISESQSSKKQVFYSDNTILDLKTLQGDSYLTESSEDEYAKESSIKNETLGNKRISPVEYRSYSSADSNTSKSQSPRKSMKSSDLKECHLKKVEEDLYNPSTSKSLPNFKTSENATPEQSTLKEYEWNENNFAMLENAVGIGPESLSTADLPSISEMLEITNAMFNFDLHAAMSEISEALATIETLTEEHRQQSHAITSKSLNPVTDPEAESCDKSESDSDTAEKDAPKSSKPRQHSRKKGKGKKKKGRKK